MPLSLIHPDWPAPRNVRAAVTTRTGGVSVAPFDLLNLGARVGDDPAAVRENRARVAATLKLPREPAWLQQVHGVHVARVPGYHEDEHADASFTAVPRQVCAILSADCLPVLFCDEGGGIVAAAHAGWRGLAAGVLEATVAAMPARPSRLIAWLGPAISRRAFEVGPEVRAIFMSRAREAAAAFEPSPNSGKWLCDLYALARLRLRRAGVERVWGGEFCTHTDSARFYSFRRDGNCGRMASLIWIE